MSGEERVIWVPETVYDYKPEVIVWVVTAADEETRPGDAVEGVYITRELAMAAALSQADELGMESGTAWTEQRVGAYEVAAYLDDGTRSVSVVPHWLRRALYD